MLSVATTAWVSNQSIRFNINGCDYWNRPKVTGVWVN